MNRRVLLISALVLTGALATDPLRAAGGRDSIGEADLRDWLTYLASDELEGRAVFTQGLGLAAGFIQERLRDWGVAPAGDRGTYLQTVRVHGVKVTNRSSVAVQIGNERRVFKDGEGVTFPRNVGGKRTLTLDRIEFSGYGLEAPGIGHSDFQGRDVSGTAIVYVGLNGPKGSSAQNDRRVLQGRSRYATDQLRAAAVIGPSSAGGAARGGSRGAAPAAGGAAPSRADAVPDFTTTQRLDAPIPPTITASDEFFEFLFSRAPSKYDELKKKANDQEPIKGFRLEGVTLTFTLDADYTIVRTQVTQNVVGIVEGSDPALKSTYVAFGAHYDHVGYADREIDQDGRRPSPPGRVSSAAPDDRIWNGADDDGSGTVALMAIARAFAQGQRPKRSLLFVWHSGEERGLYGSRYFADYPTVPIDRIVAQLNVDMIGRNRDDDSKQSNTVYLVGSDRISSELHRVNREANSALQPPLTLDYELNDPADPEQYYYRSDHYSYAAKGIPVIFFTTGIHSDYHANTDEVGRIEFGKLTRVAQMIYETGVRLADLDHAPVRDNKGARAGKGTLE